MKIHLSETLVSPSTRRWWLSQVASSLLLYCSTEGRSRYRHSSIGNGSLNSPVYQFETLCQSSCLILWWLFPVKMVMWWLFSVIIFLSCDDHVITIVCHLMIMWSPLCVMRWSCDDHGLVCFLFYRHEYRHSQKEVHVHVHTCCICTLLYV